MNREHALEVAREWLDAGDVTQVGSEPLADLLLRECAAAHEEGAREMRERAARCVPVGVFAVQDTEGEWHESDDIFRPSELAAKIAKSIREIGIASDDDTQPEPREGDVWKCDVEFIVERVPSSFAVAKFDGRTVLVSQRWLRANGRLVSRKEGGA